METISSTEVVESVQTTFISPQSVTVESTSATPTADPTTFITATSQTTKPSTAPDKSSPTESTQTSKESGSQDTDSNASQTAPAVTPSPAAPPDTPEVVVPITRASDIPPSAEVTAGNTIDKDGNKVQILAFYDTSRSDPLGTDPGTVFEGGAGGLGISVSLAFAVVVALVGQLFFL